MGGLHDGLLMKTLDHMNSLMCLLVLDPEIWIIQGTLALVYFSWFNWV